MGTAVIAEASSRSSGSVGLFSGGGWGLLHGERVLGFVFRLLREARTCRPGMGVSMIAGRSVSLQGL